MALTSCKGTWLMYDTDQKDHIYFKEQSQTHTESFALISSDTIRVSTKVYLLGMPSDHDRTFSVEYVDAAEGDSLSTGSEKYAVISARPDVDFTLSDLVMPAGEVEASLTVTLHRQPEMNSCYVRVGLRLVADDEFDVMAADSNKTAAIISPDFYVYVTDGEPACPFWWRRGTKYEPGWNMYLGKYTPAKYRRMLDLYHATEETSPVFYEYCIEHYGYYFDAEPDKTLNNEFNTFWISMAYSSAWAKYVFGPLYDYYEAYYATLPEDDPERETMGTVNINAQTGWGNPWSGTYGFLN